MPHFDLLFETAPGSPLVSFRCLQWPITQCQPLEKLPDHRPIYLDYEGKISNNRGHVHRVERGTYLRNDIDPHQSELLLSNATSMIRLVLTRQDSGIYQIQPAPQ